MSERAQSVRPESQPVIVRYAPEIALKKRRARERFRQVLGANLEAGLRRAGIVANRRPYGHGMIVATEAVGELCSLLRRTFGIESYSPVEATAPPEVDAMAEAAVRAFAKRISGQRFAVRAKARGHQAFSSMELERRIGSALNPFGTVDLSAPEITVFVEVLAEPAYLFTERRQGPGGLPGGVQGRALALVSGGFDSAVAAWRIMRRGVSVDFLFCNLGGGAYERMVLQVVKVLCDLWAIGQSPRLHVVDFAPLVAALQDSRTGSYAQPVLKRLMYRAAERVARELDCHALVTGESIGQVSSQTIANLAAIEAAVRIPVLRPLAGHDKSEILVEARRIGTEPLSARIREYCALTNGPHIVAATPERLDREEARIDQALLERALADRRAIAIDEVTAVDLRAPYLLISSIPDGAVVVDCQPRPLYERWHVPGARNLEPQALLRSIRRLDKSRTYVLYCTFGTQTPYLAEALQQAGYEAYAFEGGLERIRAHIEGRGRAKAAGA